MKHIFNTICSDMAGPVTVVGYFSKAFCNDEFVKLFLVTPCLRLIGKCNENLSNVSFLKNSIGFTQPPTQFFSPLAKRTETLPIVVGKFYFYFFEL